MRFEFRLLAILLIAAFPRLAFDLRVQAQEPIAIRMASDFTLSPDGQTLVFRWANELWSTSTLGGNVSRLTNHPAIDAEPRFSPDGKRIACLIPYERRMNLAVIDLEKKTKVLLTNFKDNDVGSLRWVGNDRLIFTQDVDGQEVPSVMAVNRDGTNPAKLFGYDSTANSSVINARFRGLLAPIEDDPGICWCWPASRAHRVPMSAK
jgi:Tol biopolymer transport system component